MMITVLIFISSHLLVVCVYGWKGDFEDHQKGGGQPFFTRW